MIQVGDVVVGRDGLQYVVHDVRGATVAVYHPATGMLDLRRTSDVEFITRPPRPEPDPGFPFGVVVLCAGGALGLWTLLVILGWA